MHKAEFLQALEARLGDLDAQERRRALDFCAESIDDRVEDGMAEEDAVAALWAAMISVYAVVASLLIAGAACALGGVALMFMQGIAPGLCTSGAGLIAFALGLWLIAPAKAAAKGLWRLTKAFGRGCKRLIVGRRKD